MSPLGRHGLAGRSAAARALVDRGCHGAKTYTRRRGPPTAFHRHLTGGPQAAQRLIAPSSARRFMERLKQRAEFLAASRGIKVPVSAFVLQVRCRGDAGPPRFGFTVARTVGNAVERNRVRRRLKEMVRT